MKMRIATKMMLASILGVVVVVSVVSFFAFHFARESLQEQIFSHMESVAQSRAVTVGTFLNERKFALENAAGARELTEALRQLDAGTKKDLNAQLQRLMGSQKHMREMYLLDCNGKVVASTNTDNIGHDKAADACFVGGRDGPYVKDPFRSERHERHVMEISAPVLDRATDKFLGVLVGRHDMSAFNEITMDITGLGKSGETYMINRDGYMITMSRFSEETFLEMDLSRTVNAGKCLADIEAMEQGKLPRRHARMAEVSPNYRKRPVLGAYALVPEMKAAVLAEINADEALEPVARLKEVLLLAGAGFAAFALVGAWMLERRITRPINELHHGSERIGAGELNYRLRIKTGDEIEQLAHEFNRMASKLSESYSVLEQKVAARTRELAIEKERLRTTIASIGDAVVSVDTAGCIALMNSVAEKLTGHYAKDVIGTPLSEVYKTMDDQSRQDAANLVGQSLRGNHSGGFEDHSVLIAKDGAEYTVAESKAPIRDANGDTLGTVIVFRDVTGEHRAFLETGRIAVIAEQAAEGIAMTDPGGTFTYVNAAWAEMHGYEPDELVGKHMKICHDQEQMITEVMPFIEEMRREGNHSGEVGHMRKDGTLFPCQMTMTMLKDQQDRPIGIISFVTDITERKRAERELARRREELKRSNVELGQFAYVVSHDLRAPLRAINGYARFLLEDCGEQLGETGKEYVEGISESAQQMHALVVDLLECSRIGRVEVALTEVDINALLERLVGRLALRNQAEVRLSADTPTVRAREVYLEQIFSNLLSNAAKFRREDAALVISVEWADQLDAWEFSVRDNGIGIPEDRFDNIFGIFHRLHTQEEYEGTGIGLAIVKKAVEVQGGRVWIESTPGEGSVFRFTLPKKIREE